MTDNCPEKQRSILEGKKKKNKKAKEEFEGGALAEKEGNMPLKLQAKGPFLRLQNTPTPTPSKKKQK